MLFSATDMQFPAIAWCARFELVGELIRIRKAMITLDFIYSLQLCILRPAPFYDIPR